MSDDMTDPEKAKQYRIQPRVAPAEATTTPQDSAPTPSAPRIPVSSPATPSPSIGTPQPINVSDQQIEQITKNASKPDAAGLISVITYYIAGWLILSNGWTLYSILSNIAYESARVAPGIADGVILPLSISVMILGLLAGIGLLFFRDIARKATLLYIGLSLIFLAYSTIAVLRISFMSMPSTAVMYYIAVQLFIPVNAVLFLTYKPTKRLFH